MAINPHAVKTIQKGEEVMSLKTQRDKFQRYLTLLFHDLCAKTNGLTKKEIDEYTFMKVRIYIYHLILVFLTARFLKCEAVLNDVEAGSH